MSYTVNRFFSDADFEEIADVPLRAACEALARTGPLR